MYKPRIMTGVSGLLVIAAAILPLSGCGGSGGGTAALADGVGTGGTGSASTGVVGIASKGIVKNAAVLVCKIIGGAVQADASCLSTTTGTDGSYSVTFSDGYTGPVMVRITATATSTMVDETTGKDVPYTATMRAVLPSISGTATAYVTPFSEMAAHAALMAGTMDSTTIRQSINEVRSMMASLDIDFDDMPMVDLKNSSADSATLTRQANMVKQLSRIMMAAKNSALLKDASGNPCNAAGTTAAQQVACAIAAMNAIMTGYASSDPARVANLMTALNAQNVTSVQMPVRTAGGSILMQPADMTSLTSMTTAMQSAGMAAPSAQSVAGRMMAGMR